MGQSWSNEEGEVGVTGYIIAESMTSLNNSHAPVSSGQGNLSNSGDGSIISAWRPLIILLILNKYGSDWRSSLIWI